MVMQADAVYMQMSVLAHLLRHSLLLVSLHNVSGPMMQPTVQLPRSQHTTSHPFAEVNVPTGVVCSRGSACSY